MKIISFILTNDCNLNCCFCPTRKNANFKKHISYQKIIETLDNINTKDYDIISVTGGEPTISNNFSDFLKRVKEKNIKVEVKTNLVKFSDENFTKYNIGYIDIISFSIFADNDLNYNKTTGMNNIFSQIESALKNIKKYNKKTILNANILIHKYSYDKILNIVSYLLKYDINCFYFWYVSSKQIASNDVNIIEFKYFKDSLFASVKLLENHKKQIKIMHFPLCFLEDYRKYFYNERSEDQITMFDGDTSFELKDEGMADYIKTDKCNFCSQKNNCIGLRLDYYNKFGDSSLNAFKVGIVVTRQYHIINNKKLKASHILINGICNLKCIFCFSRESLIKNNFSFEKIKQSIREEFNLNSSILVISGGEPTIHPNFLDIIAFAKEIGYVNISVITNGIAFSNKEFLDTAVKNGLNSIKLSFHSHERSVYDFLTKSDLMYEKAILAINNITSKKEVDFTVNIVVNNYNIKDIWKTIYFLKLMNVNKIDLLRIMPFGRAFDNKDMLIINDELNYQYLKKAILFARKEKITLNTNRFPLSLVNYFKDESQNFIKLFNEIKSKNDEFSDLILKGIPLYCYPTRCKYCFLEKFCKEIHLQYKYYSSIQEFVKYYIKDKICDEIK